MSFSLASFYHRVTGFVTRYNYQVKSSISWDLTPLFKSDTDPHIIVIRQEVEKVAQAFINKWQGRSDYLSDPVVLKQALDEYENWAKEYGLYDREILYFHLRTCQDQLDSKLKASFNQIIEHARKLQNEIQFFVLRLAKVSAKQQALFLDHPDLKPYHHYLEQLFKQAKHQLTEAEEKILNLKSEPSYGNWVRMLEEFLSQEVRIGKTLPDFMSMLQTKNKLARDQAARAINSILKKHAPAAVHEINSILANKKIDDDLRHFPRPESASHLSDDIDTELVDTITDSVAGQFQVSARWYTIKAKLLGLTKLKYHERYIPLGEVDMSYSYNQATELVGQVFTHLDPEFGQVFSQFVTHHQIDVYPAKGKSDGAFCAPGSLVLPTYILLNHTGVLKDVLTLAHEAGHGINNELMKRTQNALNFGSPLSTAEVASTFFEDIVLQKLIANADDETKLSLLAKKLDDDVATIFRQTACYLFERELHQEFRKKGYLGQVEIGQLFQKHMAAYMGPAVTQSPGSENWWIYWGHIRRFFYVYTYASGLLISKSLQASVKKDKTFITKVKKFLSIGSSQSPQEIFADLGIDITQKTFWETGLAEVEALLIEVESLAKKLGKI